MPWSDIDFYFFFRFICLCHSSGQDGCHECRYLSGLWCLVLTFVKGEMRILILVSEEPQRPVSIFNPVYSSLLPF